MGRYFLDIVGQTNCSTFTIRLPHSYMKLIVVSNGLLQKFWHENNRPSSNQKYVTKLIRVSKDHETHIKHFLDMTHIELYERINNAHPTLNLGL